MAPASDEPNLGPCCACGRETSVARNVVLLSKLAPVPGRGWGCVQCHLPPDGAVAVLCDACLPALGDSVEGLLRWACRGFPDVDGRVHVGEFRGEFRHDRRFHPEMAEDDPG